MALAGAALGLLALSARLRTLAVAPLLVFAALGTALPAAAQMTINMGADASLSALSVPGGRSNPPFTPGRLNHSTTVDDTVSRVTVTATPSQPGATVEYLKTNFSALQDADPSSADTFEVDLGTRLNTYFRVRVTGTDGHTTRTYLLNVHRSARSNNAPTVSNEIPDRTATTGTAFKYAFPSDTFSDVDRDALTYTATKADGTVLPTWLAFTAATRTFAGMPQAADVEMVSVKVTASDGTKSVSDTFDIRVTEPSRSTSPRSTHCTSNLLELWCATMTVAVSGNNTGFQNGAGQTFGSLSDDEFTVASATQRIWALSYTLIQGNWSSQ